MNARERYDQLSSDRTQFLDTAVECSTLTLPYLIKDDLSNNPNHKSLIKPWQSVGAKAVVTLAAKLMLALLPPQTTFFKLQVRDGKFFRPSLPIKIRELPPTIKCLSAWCTTTLSLEAAIKSITILSILEKDKSNSLLISGGISSPILSSLICSLKNEVCGGSNANISFAANVTTAFAPTLCQG